MQHKIKALLVDDEKNGREVMASLLQYYCPEIMVVGQANSAESAYNEIVGLQPDLVFLDIQMPKEDGFSLLQRFENVPFEVIFVTGFDQYAIDAIRCNALDYLLKPVAIEDLQRAVKKAVTAIEKKESSAAQILHLLHDFEALSKGNKIFAHSGDKVKLLESRDIVYIEADDNYSKIHMKDSAIYITSRHLTEYETYFGDASSFLRISRSHIINVDAVISYSKGYPCSIQMVSGEWFEASRRKKPEVLKRLVGHK